MSSRTLDAVLPLIREDGARFEILHESLSRFCRGMGTCWVVTPDRDLEAIRPRIQDSRYRLIPESSIIPELKFYNLARKVRWFDRRRSTTGWFVQQLVKMAIAPAIESDFYLTLDADVICVKPVRLPDLIDQGRARSTRYRYELHRDWYQWAERVLELPSSGLIHGITPSLLSRDAMMKLHRYLEGRLNPLLRRLANVLPSTARDLVGGWRSYLLRNLPWTEYALYNTFLEATGLWDQYHYESQDSWVAGNSLWEKEKFSSWDPEKSFKTQKDFYFSVVQSNTGLSAADIWEKVGAYLSDRK